MGRNFEAKSKKGVVFLGGCFEGTEVVARFRLVGREESMVAGKFMKPIARLWFFDSAGSASLP